MKKPSTKYQNLQHEFPIEFRTNFFLAEFKPDDAERLFETIDDNRAYLRRWLPWLDRNVSPKDSLSFIQDCKIKNKQMKSLTLGIFYRKQIIGVISFHKFDWGKLETSMGYWLSEKWQGRGLITEGCKILIDWAFQKLGMIAVKTSCATDNVRSRSIPEKLHFLFEKEQKKKEWLYDHFVDHAIYSMTKEHWNTLHRKGNGIYS